MPPKTMFEKIWDAHVVHEEPGEPAVIYIDLHLVHEVTSPQAFDGLRMAGRPVRRTDLTVATADHNTPTWDLSLPVTDEISRAQLDALTRNCEEFGVTLYDRFSPLQGIVHIIGPDLGYTQPGKTVVCGDSHTSTHGALGAFAVGIGTSEVEHVLATQTLRQFKPRTMEVRVDGEIPPGRDRQGHHPRHHRAHRRQRRHRPRHRIHRRSHPLPLHGRRMTVCNMSIEAGARAGMIAPDETTFEYVRGRQFAPQGADFDAAVERWKQLPTDPGATFDKTEIFDAAAMEPTLPGARTPAWWPRSAAGCRTRLPLKKLPSRKPHPAPFSTWIWPRALPFRT